MQSSFFFRRKHYADLPSMLYSLFKSELLLNPPIFSFLNLLKFNQVIYQASEISLSLFFHKVVDYAKQKWLYYSKLIKSKKFRAKDTLFFGQRKIGITKINFLKIIFHHWRIAMQQFSAEQVKYFFVLTPSFVVFTILKSI